MSDISKPDMYPVQSRQIELETFDTELRRSCKSAPQQGSHTFYPPDSLHTLRISRQPFLPPRCSIAKLCRFQFEVTSCHFAPNPSVNLDSHSDKSRPLQGKAKGDLEGCMDVQVSMLKLREL